MWVNDKPAIIEVRLAGAASIAAGKDRVKHKADACDTVGGCLTLTLELKLVAMYAADCWISAMPA